MSANVFVYGTLLVPEMMHAVAGREYRFVSATADGYVRYLLKGRIYPGIAAEPGSQVEGIVYLDVDADALARLDYFEGPEYVREQLQVSVADGRVLAAQAYVVPEAKRQLLTDQQWSLDDFIASGLADFVAHARAAMRSYAPGTQVER